jgi:putative photosynthetic complex assembly protein
MSDHGQESFPRTPLLAIGGLVLLSLLAVGIMQLTGAQGQLDVTTANGETPSIIERQELIFRDLENGAVAVIDPASQVQLTRIEPGTNGFMRSTLRGLGRERMRQNLTPDEPFEIQILDNGRALLVDPSIDRVIDLWAFGESNAMNFINLFNETKAIMQSADFATDDHQLASHASSQE